MIHAAWQEEKIVMNKQTPMVPVQTSPEHGVAAVFGRLRHEIDQLFDDFTLPGAMRSLFPVAETGGFSPLADLKDKSDHYELALELPGMEDKDIDVQFADGILTIAGEKREEKEEKSDGCLISERSYGSFQRQMSLPRDVDPDGIAAKLDHGVLTVTIAKDKDAARRVRKIAVG